MEGDEGKVFGKGRTWRYRNVFPDRHTVFPPSTTGIPEEPAPDGTVVTQSGKPRIGVWLMPDNRVPGMLEDFVEFLVPEKDPLLSCAKEAVDLIPAKAESLLSRV